jgi:hypothetical protein
MAWTSISNGAVAVGGIPSSSLVTALRDNPGAMAAAESGAPVVFAGWHPYNKVSVGDGQTGLIYSHAVDGNIAEIVTPDFEDGFEYKLIADALSHNNGSATGLQLGLYEETGGSYDTAVTIGSETAANFWNVDIDILTPRLVSTVHFAVIRAFTTGTITGTGVQTSGTAQRVLRARLRFAAGSIDAGRVWMLRRADYLTTG